MFDYSQRAGTREYLDNWDRIFGEEDQEEEKDQDSLDEDDEIEEEK